MGAEDSQESELDVGRVGSGIGQAALPVGAERDHLEGILRTLSNPKLIRDSSHLLELRRHIGHGVT